MQGMFVSTFLTVSIFLSIGAPDVNVMRSCDPKIPLSLSWSPKILRTGTTYNLDFYYGGKTFSIAEINLCLKVWQVGDEEPIFDNCEKHVCKDFLKYILIIFKNASCPWKFSSTNITIKQFLDYEVPVLEGDFKLFLDITDTATNQRILCIDGDVSMVE